MYAPTSTNSPRSGPTSGDDDALTDFDGAGEILRAWVNGLRPDPDLTVSEWADRHRMLSGRASAEPGRYRTVRTPYTPGKTAVGLAWPTRRMVLMTDWTETELSALRRAYASGTTRVSYDGKSVDYGSAEDLLARIYTIERAIAGVSRPLPVAGLAGFSRGDR